MNYNARDKLWLRYRARAFSGEVGTGSPQKMRPLKDNWSEILLHWNGVRSKARFVAGKPDQECAHSIRATPASHGRCAGVIRIRGNADVAEPVDATDLKSVEGNLVRVRVPPSAPTLFDEGGRLGVAWKGGRELLLRGGVRLITKLCHHRCAEGGGAGFQALRGREAAEVILRRRRRWRVKEFRIAARVEVLRRGKRPPRRFRREVRFSAVPVN
jgi:hypothetical protein